MLHTSILNVVRGIKIKKKSIYSEIYFILVVVKWAIEFDYLNIFIYLY